MLPKVQEVVGAVPILLLLTSPTPGVGISSWMQEISMLFFSFWLQSPNVVEDLVVCNCVSGDEDLGQCVATSSECFCLFNLMHQQI